MINRVKQVNDSKRLDYSFCNLYFCHFFQSFFCKLLYWFLILSQSCGRGIAFKSPMPFFLISPFEVFLKFLSKIFDIFASILFPEISTAIFMCSLFFAISFGVLNKSRNKCNLLITSITSSGDILKKSFYPLAFCFSTIIVMEAGKNFFFSTLGL